jgi:MinD superfamily P-loop ATPase
LTHAALAAADVVLVVGTPDPVGVARLARALDEVGELTAGRPVHVVLNRWRPRLGIDEAEVRRLLAGFGAVAAFHVVPDDALAADRSLATGRMVHEAGPSPLARSFAPLADALFPAVATSAPEPAPRRGLRRRTAAAGRPR